MKNTCSKNALYLNVVGMTIVADCARSACSVCPFPRPFSSCSAECKEWVSRNTNSDSHHLRHSDSSAEAADRREETSPILPKYLKKKHIFE